MNILFLGYAKNNYASYICREFEQLGNHVHFLPLDDGNQSWMYQSLYRRGKAGGRLGRFVLNALIHRSISEHKIDVLILRSNYTMHPRALRLIKRRGVKVVLWEGNLEFSKPFQVACVPQYDLIVVADSYIVPFLREVMGHSNIHCSHGRAVPSEFQPPDVTPEQMNCFGADVSFVGRFFSCRDEFFERFGRQVRIWGDQWPAQSRLPYRNEIEPIDAAEKPTVFACSKINLHLRAGHQQINAFSTRVFEVPLCGGFILAEWSKDLEYCFDIEHEIAVFKTPDECREQVDYYLKHEDERRAMTERLRKRIMKDYTLTEAVARVNDSLMKLCTPEGVEDN